MTDNEIIRALECCNLQKNGDCPECPLRYSGDWWVCSEIILKNALDLINRQKAEIARLQTDVAPVRHVTNRARYFDETLCPNCGIHLDETTIISKDENEDGDIIHYEFQPNFCANCGARMDGDSNADKT